MLPSARTASKDATCNIVGSVGDIGSLSSGSAEADTCGGGSDVQAIAPDSSPSPPGIRPKFTRKFSRSNSAKNNGGGADADAGAGAALSEQAMAGREYMEGSATKISTQAEMCQQFIPILKERGTLITKKGRRLARPARPGEEVNTIIDGQLVAKAKASDDTSMVIRQESADHELYLLSASKFQRNYHEFAVEIRETEPSFEELRQRGYKWYERRGQLMIYQLTDRDMELIPSACFHVSFSVIPQPVRAGDYLVTVVPECDEIYVSPHVTIYNDDGQLAAPIGVRTQEEMCQHFIPILKEHGKVVKKTGKRLARQAKRGEMVLTVINGEVVAKTVVADDTTMVVRQESADHELYALDKDKFSRNYESGGYDINAGGEPRFEELRERGFKYYERKGQLLIYQVTDKDLEFVPSGKFQVSFSTIPQPLREGHFLVTTLPDMKEVYVTPHAVIYNDDGQLFQPPGVCSQEEMRSHFLPIMRERGTRMRRAGRRLARHANRGEEVLTIVNTEVICKHVVPDDTSMVIQEESADRELFVLSQKNFDECYDRASCTEIVEKDHESEALRRRGFKYFEKTKGVALIYRVQADDMKFVPGGRFQVPWSIIPQPLKAGDYLVTRESEEDVIYMSRNADQIFFSQENLEVHFVFASPLDEDPLSLDAELEGIRTSGAVVRITCAKREHLSLLKKAWCGSAPCVLHISGHTATDPQTGETKIAIENEDGSAFQLEAGQFLNLVIGGGPAPETVVISSCSSQALATEALKRGVRRAVAVRDNERLLDRAARDFAYSFYGELRSHRSVETAFKVAKESMLTSREPGVSKEVSKLVLLTDDGSPEPNHEFHLGAGRRGHKTNASLELEPYVAVPLPFGAGEAGHIGPLVYPRSALPRMAGGVVPDSVAPSRREFVKRTLDCFANKGFRVLKICGPEGSGKAHFAGLLASFAALPGGRFFSGGAVVVNRSADGGVLSQERMCERFIPILKSKGILVRKVGSRLARPARKGEEVNMVVNGEIISKVKVTNDTSMVIRQETTDHELYVLDENKFIANYEAKGTEITEQSSEFATLRERGFKHYERKGMLMIYRVTEEDMKLVPGGKFEVSFSTIPQPVKVGDYLVTGYPEFKEVYMTRNAAQIYSTQIIRSQEEMRSHFLPTLMKQGTLVKRVGAWLARPARKDEEIMTIINGEVISKTVVADETDMVVRTESCDGEWYVLSDRDFTNNYERPGTEIVEEGEQFDIWRLRGFKRFRRKGMLRIYKLTRADLEFLPGGRFWGKNGNEPQRVRVGDHLVADYPAYEEVYMCYNAEQIFDVVPSSEIVRSQAEMKDHFVPLMRQHGLLMERAGRRLARPARRGEEIITMIDAEVVAKALVADDTSMVVQEDTADKELSLYSADSFQRHFVTEELDIEGVGYKFDSLRARSYKQFETKRGRVLIHQVIEDDMAFVPGGQFQVSFSSVPQPLRPGDHLVTNYPDCDEVYLNRNALQSYRFVDSKDERPNSISAMLSTRSASGSFVQRLRSDVLTGRNVGTAGEDENLANEITPSMSRLASDSSMVSIPSGSNIAQPVDPGLRARVELEDALCAAASQQATCATRWYRKRAGAGVQIDEATEAENAVAAWMAAAPPEPRAPNGRALLVLVDGAKFLAHEQPRDLLRRLLRKHPGLYLLVTVTVPPRNGVDDAEAAAARIAMNVPPKPLDPQQVCELPKMIQIQRLSDQETADLFFSAMMRSQQGRPLGRLLAQMGRQKSVGALEKHPVIVACQGLPDRAIREAELVDANVRSLDELRSATM